MQLLPRLINLIFLNGIKDSNKFTLIFKFSNIKSALYVLLASIPPTFAAALTM